jgi:chitin disaccharide deacetylase
MVKRIILCADDYGQNPGISQGILKLIRARRITATSCLVNSKDFEVYGPQLLPFSDRVDIGLHLNLTHGYALGPVFSVCKSPGRRFPSVGRLLLKSLLLQTVSRSIFQEFERQLLRFQQVMGRLPDFLDGHQHIHHFPVVQKALKRLILTYCVPSGRAFYVRSVWAVRGRSWGDLKTLLIRYSGAYTLERWLRRRALSYNTSFTGIYDFGTKQSVEAVFDRCLRSVLDGGLMMCHPGLASQETNDPLYFRRPEEFEFLMSEAFDACLARNEVQLIRGVDHYVSSTDH